MEKANDNQTLKYDDPTWYSLAEFSLCKATSDEETAVGSLLRIIRELGLPPETLKRIEGTITDTVSEAMSEIDPAESKLPVRICLFCQRRMIDELQRVITPKPLDAEQSVESAEIFQVSKTKVHGGWGYFLIDRSKDFHPAFSRASPNVVELYLYREGG